MRLVLTTLVASAGLMLAVVALGAASPVGFLLAMSPLYLLWTWIVDVNALLRSTFRSSESYVARPHYWLWVTSCALPLGAWSPGRPLLSPDDCVGSLSDQVFRCCGDFNDGSSPHGRAADQA